MNYNGSQEESSSKEEKEISYCLESFGLEDPTLQPLFSEAYPYKILIFTNKSSTIL